MAYIFSRRILGPYLHKRVTKLEGVENIPKDGGVLFVANHVGWHDPLLTAFSLIKSTGNKKIHSLTEWGMFEKPILGKWMGAIPVMKDKVKALQTASDLLRQGKNILIYPQGGIDNTDSISNAKTGVARLALLSQCRVIPIGLTRHDPVETKEWRKYKEIFTGKISIKIGAPVDVTQYYDQEVTKELLYDVTNTILSEVAKLANKKYIPRTVDTT